MVEKLESFGLTKIEAKIYLKLLSFEQLGCYELSQETDISKSNVYNSIKTLEKKGAVYAIEGSTKKYTAVPPEQFLENRLNELRENADFVIQNAPSREVQNTGYITVKGARNIRNKIAQMLSETQLRLYILAETQLLELFREQLSSLVADKKKVVIFNDEFTLKGAKIYKVKPEPGQLRFITDSNFVLTGELTGSENDTCLYSGQKNLVEVMKEALGSKIPQN